MTYHLDLTRHARERMEQRGISLKRMKKVVHYPAHRYPGNQPKTKKFVGDKPPPPVAVVTSWPPEAGGSLKVITCYAVGEEGGALVTPKDSDRGRPRR